MITRLVNLWSFAWLLGLPAGALAIDNQKSSAVPLVTQSPITTPAANADQPARPLKQIMAEVQKMVESGASADTIKAFIQSWTTPYSLTANDILHLHDVGVPSEVLTTLIQRGAQLQAKATPVLPSPSTAPNLVTTNPPAVLYPYPGNANTVTGTNAPMVLYPYPAGNDNPYTYSSLYPYAPYLGYSPYTYWPSPNYYTWPYYGYYGYYGYRSPRYYYPYSYGYRYPGYRHIYPGRPYGGGWGRPGPGSGWRGHGRR